MAKEEKKSASPPAEPGGINTGVAIIGFILCFVAGALVMWGYSARKLRTGDISADTAAGATWNDNDSPIPVSSQDPVWGKRDAPVTVVVFSDYQCPFCGKVEPTIDQVKQTYGPDKVRVVWKNEPLPMHPNAKPAAEAGQGVFALKGNDAFWKWHETAFKNQQALSTDNYIKWATAQGVDAAKYKAGLDAHTWAKKVEDDHALAGKVGVNGTPAAYINGISVSGAQPFDKFKAVIDQELTKADAKSKAGTPKDKMYVTLTKDNFKAAPAEEKEEEDTKTVWKIPVGKAPFKGPATAPITVIEFSDFQCPYCKRAERTLVTLEKKYEGKMRLVWMNEPLPFHPRAIPAATLALEARGAKGDKGFWDAHDKMFGPLYDGGQEDPQKPPPPTKLEDTDLQGYAKEMGLDPNKLMDAINNDKYDEALDAEMTLANRFQASGTPHFFVNGRRLVGAQPQEAFEKIFEEELKKANDLLAKGTKPEGLYDALIKDGKEPPEPPPPPPPERKDVAFKNTVPVKGNGKVIIQEFSDFQCPYCARVEDTLKKVMKKYDGKVKLAWRHMPLEFHADAPLASEAAEEAFKQKGNDGFWKMHDMLFDAQKKPDGLKRESLESYAKQLGLDMEKFKAALDDHRHKATVDAEAKVGKDAGIQGTPAFVINGYFINGAQPYKEFKRVIDIALKEAK
jgi:protein-disulfide isomerase